MRHCVRCGKVIPDPDLPFRLALHAHRPDGYRGQVGGMMLFCTTRCLAMWAWKLYADGFDGR